MTYRRVFRKVTIRFVIVTILITVGHFLARLTVHCWAARFRCCNAAIQIVSPKLKSKSANPRPLADPSTRGVTAMFSSQGAEQPFRPLALHGLRPYPTP